MKKRLGVLSVVTLLVMALFSLSAMATNAEIYLSADKNGQSRVSTINEGEEVWIAVYDPDENIDCDTRDKIWTDVKLFDPKTGAYAIWDTNGYYGKAGDLAFDYLEETGADTGLFVSKRAIQIGGRLDFDLEVDHYHIDGPDFTVDMGAFVYGLDGVLDVAAETDGRIENMDTLVVMYQDQNDESDVAVGMAKITDNEATIVWDQEVYKDANGTATITVVDADENLNCNEVEWVPVFIIVNPGSWNATDEVNSFCSLKQRDGFDWFTIYDLRGITYDATFDSVAGDQATTNVVFYAQETGVNTGVFQLNLNSILVDLAFNDLRVRDVLVAYYLDPNDEDDFKLATAYIEERQHSIVSFTDASRGDKDLYWLGRDPIYVQVIDSNANVDPCCPEQVAVLVCDPHGTDDAEWLILDETSSNSPVFFTNAGMELEPVWDALGVGIDPANTGGFQLALDNWTFEAFNEDSVYVRYNDVYYTMDETGLGGIGDGVANSTADTAWPPMIDRVRVANDVSFDLMEIADTQVFNGETTSMYFLDRQGNRVNGFVNSDCVFIEVVDADQDEDQLRRERIDGFWDGGQNMPFGPMALNEFVCDFDPQSGSHTLNALLGDTNIFNNGEYAKVYVLNPRNGRWAAVDLLETGVATGDFVSVICIDLTNVYTCVPTLGVLPGDTIVAFYQDPSNHSDSAMISVKVGIGGGGTPPTQASTAMFVDADGNEVANYTDADSIFVKVIDPSHAGATLLADAVEIGGITFDLAPLAGAQNDTFITAALDLGVDAADSITVTYTDPTDPTDVASDTITIIASVLEVEEFFAGPSPFDGECAFGFAGTGVASVFAVEVYNLTGGLVWAAELANVTEIVWNGTDASGAQLANGAYIYVITATDGTDTFTGEGTVFISR